MLWATCRARTEVAVTTVSPALRKHPSLHLCPLVATPDSEAQGLKQLTAILSLFPPASLRHSKTLGPQSLGK